MSQTVALLFGVHAHQPVGNFPAVLDDAHERCYRPFIRTLHRYPGFRFAVHISGWLLGYLAERFPEDVALLRDMVGRGQVELFGGGDYEPVLAAIPSRDRVGQLRKLATRLDTTLGAVPQGAWLTERVWESSVVPGLVESGVRYVTVDDYHFLCAGRSEAELDGYFATEEGGVRLDLYPISEALRYRIPFAPAHEVVSYIEGLARRPHAAAVYFDDIEKFGIWPETHDWVYGRRWLEQFIEGVLASPRIEARLYCSHHANAPARGVVYLPTTSYIEMNEWTLPAGPAGTFAGMVDEAKASGRYGERKPFIRGGIWRNFLSRYGESNWMHKRMVALSARLAAEPSAASEQHLDELYRAQANDAYWHGLFGGLYLPHLRRALWRSIARLEAMLPARPGGERVDLDLDGCEEAFLRSSDAQAVVRVDADGAVIELTSYRLAHNFGDTLRRYREHYFRRIEANEQQAGHAGGGIASAHDRVEFKHPVVPADLVEDARGRYMFLDSVPGADGNRVVPEYTPAREAAGDTIAFAAMVGDLGVRKTLRLVGSELAVTYRLTAAVPARFATELNVAMPSCDGFGGRYAHDGGFPGGFGQEIELAGVTQIALEDSELGGRLFLRASVPVALRAAPHHTVSQSEAGFEKIMQAACLELEWAVPAGTHEVTITLAIDHTSAGAR